MALPTDGQLNWGDPLNAEITADETNISTNATAIANHKNNIPADPHGDRAYANSLVSPITTGVNQPGGYVVLGSNGKLPLSIIPSGAGLTGWVDAVATYLTTEEANGTLPADSAINAAIQSLSATGGICYIGPGTFNLSQPLVMYANIWLLCAPGATFNRIVTSQAPAAMVQNYLATSAPSGGQVPNGGNIHITGGTWNVVCPSPYASSTGSAFIFANNQTGNVSGVILEDMFITAVPNGHSPAVRLFGISNVDISNVQITDAIGPTGSRSLQIYPLIQIEELNDTNWPGLPTTMYLSAFPRCSNITVRGCSLTADTLSDSEGHYSAWSSFCGSIGIIASNATHTNINVVQGNYANALAVAGVQTLNWNNLTCTGNQFTFPATAYIASWNPTTLVSTYIGSFVFDINSPRVYIPSTTGNCQNTTTETILSQFIIPANDWIVGTTSYRHHHSGLLWYATGTLTLKLYIGPNGNNTDTLVETFSPTLTSCSSVQYALHHLGFDINTQGGSFTNAWAHLGWQMLSSGLNPGFQGFMANATPAVNLTSGVPLYVTTTAKWSVANTGNIIRAYSGAHERISL